MIEKILGRRIGLSRVYIALERGARAFWPVWTLLFVLYALSAFGALSGLSQAGVMGVYAGFAIAVLVAFGIGLKRFEMPERSEAVARLDEASDGFVVSALEDTQATGLNDPAAQALWARHQDMMAERAESVRVAPPDLRLSGRDPWALRLMAVVGVLAALIFARGDGFSGTAIVPDGGDPLAAGPSFEAWASPPAYTGKPVIYLTEDTDGKSFDLPQGTEIVMRVYGGADEFSLQENISGGVAGLSASAAGIAETNFTVETSGALSIARGGEEMAAWDFIVVPDTPPTIRLMERISRNTEGAMELKYKGSDDYGITSASVEIALALDEIDRTMGLAVDPVERDIIRLDLPMPFTGNTKAIEEILIEDLSKHPWAGLPVRLKLEATDAAEQVDAENTEAMDLPGRRFFDPLAGAIVEQRRDLLWSPDNVTRVHQVLLATTYRPDDIFRSRKAYLVTRSAVRRLGYAMEDGMTEEEIEDVAEFLWQAALLIEDGDLASARERLKQAQDRLEEAIRNGATDEEIAELMQELREAMDDYMRQLAQEAERNGEEMQQAQNPEDGQTMDQSQLQELLDEIQRLMEEGQMAEAQQLLEMLRQMMENMQIAEGQGQGEGQQGQGQQLMQDLQETLRQQQDLADESFSEMQRQFQEQRQQQGQQGQQGQQQGQQGEQGQQGQQGQSGQGQGGQGQQQGQQPGQGNPQGQQQPGPGQSGGQGGQGEGMTPDQLAERQEALRQLLDDLQSQVPGGGPDGEAARRALDEAERNMGEARDNLEDGDLPGALDNQADAIEALRDGIQNFGEEMRQQAMQEGGQGDQPGGDQANGPDNQSQDPLGRPTGANGQMDSRDSLLPGEEAIRRSRELLEEIRKRAADQSRPQVERDYLKRLLERF